MRNFTLESIALGIARDPVSWSGIALTYVRFADDRSADAFFRALPQDEHDVVLRGYRQDGALLSQEPIAKPDGTVCYCAIADIATDWKLAAAALHIPPQATEELKVPGEKLSLLIVEDDPLTSKMVAHQLQKFGTITTTANAREAIANSMVLTPDIIFLDIHYRDDIHDGFDVLTNLLSAMPKAFVVMFSADRHPATVARALALGAQGFIAKPFRPADFMHYLIQFASQSA